MLKKVMCFMLLLLLLAACSEEPVIVKKDSPPENPDSNPAIVKKQTNVQDEAEKFVEFALPDEQIMINLEMVPILNVYLRTSKNREKAIREMNLSRIEADSKELYLLEFSCHKKLCSYLLLDKSKKNQAYLVADMAKSMQIQLSPDNDKIMLHFNRKQTTPVPLSDIVVIDLKNWVPLTLENKSTDEQLLGFKWPLISSYWFDNNTIEVVKPAVPKPTKSNMDKWQQNSVPVTKIQFDIRTQ
ncbi:hypothetical protein [Virgibacillus siamensis]|uniref:hypothetical protein n=1 Tax=Virgibacillus siamensis TaxID=480071 RepID=UPI0009876AB6|nr:hypothetical protein [Virgibacillus siamensis]